MDDQESPSILSENNNNNNIDQNTNNDDLSNKPKGSPPSSAVKKRRGAVQLIKVALYMIRRRSGKNKTVDVTSSGGSIWNCLVGSMRPLHLQSHGSPCHRHSIHDENDVVKSSSSPSPSPSPSLIQTAASPMSPGASSSYSSSSSDDEMSRYASAANLQELDTESRYASATNLRELDNDDSECDDRKTNNNNNLYDENGGDEMIDVKAEEFIAQFYKQIRLQRLNSMDRHYNEMIQRSIG
ncbi:uncharacterized protein LOC133819065 [Humulus lupulus]|uniref:uncharacterized protein LOC133819065 n=1 Tax=Humulus lupulus TaxID=3486 RepID=UPI002B411A44|nr:uncharacterized protein LOC133819065 [Humulus lupulus]